MNIVRAILEPFKAIGELFYPPVCATCGTHLLKNELEVCMMCIRALPRTHFENMPDDNVISALLWGRCRIKLAYSLFYYRKGEQVQRLLHEIKYRGNKNLGIEMGRRIGKSILSSGCEAFDAIVPIPLHPQKQRRRGFNQAEVIAIGISEVIKVPVNTNIVFRNKHTASQTKKGRFERWKNVENIFSVRNNSDSINKHLLLIDDVITTGSTMEACVNQLTLVDGLTVSVATIACASL